MWSSLLGDACPILAIPLIDAGGNDDKTFGIRGRWNVMALVNV